MPYFPVDDQAAFHPKVVAAGNAAMGLWVRAGSWSKAHAEGGRIPKEIAAALGTDAQAKRLVQVGLWEAVKGGFQFHDWSQQAGNLGPEEEKARREANRIRQQRHRDKQRESHVSNGVTDALVTSRPSPVPSPLETDTQTRPVLESVGEALTDDRNPVDNSAHWAQFGITDIGAVRRAIVTAIGHPISEPECGRIVGWIMAKAETSGTKPRSMQAYVLASIRKSWAEVQQYWHEELAS